MALRRQLKEFRLAPKVNDWVDPKTINSPEKTIPVLPQSLPKCASKAKLNFRILNTWSRKPEFSATHSNPLIAASFKNFTPSRTALANGAATFAASITPLPTSIAAPATALPAMTPALHVSCNTIHPVHATQSAASATHSAASFTASTTLDATSSMNSMPLSMASPTALRPSPIADPTSSSVSTTSSTTSLTSSTTPLAPDSSYTTLAAAKTGMWPWYGQCPWLNMSRRRRSSGVCTRAHRPSRCSCLINLRRNEVALSSSSSVSLVSTDAARVNGADMSRSRRSVLSACHCRMGAHANVVGEVVGATVHALALTWLVAAWSFPAGQLSHLDCPSEF